MAKLVWTCSPRRTMVERCWTSTAGSGHGVAGHGLMISQGLRRPVCNSTCLTDACSSGLICSSSSSCSKPIHIFWSCVMADLGMMFASNELRICVAKRPPRTLGLQSQIFCSMYDRLWCRSPFNGISCRSPVYNYREGRMYRLGNAGRRIRRAMRTTSSARQSLVRINNATPIEFWSNRRLLGTPGNIRR